MKYVMISGSADVDYDAGTMVVGTMLEDYTDMRYVKFSMDDWNAAGYPEGSTLGDMIHTERMKLKNGQPSFLKEL